MDWKGFGFLLGRGQAYISLSLIIDFRIREARVKSTCWFERMNSFQSDKDIMHMIIINKGMLGEI